MTDCYWLDAWLGAMLKYSFHLSFYGPYRERGIRNTMTNWFDAIRNQHKVRYYHLKAEEFVCCEERTRLTLHHIIVKDSEWCITFDPLPVAKVIPIERVIKHFYVLAGFQGYFLVALSQKIAHHSSYPKETKQVFIRFESFRRNSIQSISGSFTWPLCCVGNSGTRCDSACLAQYSTSTLELATAE